ncbi:helix-turn-helix domain-containing protein [Sporosarcina sp. USHLN248]|uniref:helix-turn-helix domain-containing protein n=1 Tax=Sporosarcina sp. USHLN248 TaxID=3081300 RepID=UPI0038B68D26
MTKEGSFLEDEQTIQRAVEWIEENLDKEIQLTDVANFSGYSKYHFHRLFQSVLNMTVDQYIRTRRLAAAAVLLLHSNERIIDIAFHALFNSQEAFSRAFKKAYHLSPGEYRRIMRSIILIKEECFMQEIKGWFLSGSHPQNYRMGIDRQIVHIGKASGFLHSEFVTGADEFATMMQQFKADQFIGKRVKLSCFIKCEEVQQFAGAWMRVDNQIGDVLQFDNMSNRPISGTMDWNFYSLVLDVPANSSVISFGVLLQGKGKLWVNQFHFEEVAETTATTNLELVPKLLDEPVNLSFEE